MLNALLFTMVFYLVILVSAYRSTPKESTSNKLVWNILDIILSVLLVRIVAVPYAKEGFLYFLGAFFVCFVFMSLVGYVQMRIISDA